MLVQDKINNNLLLLKTQITHFLLIKVFISPQQKMVFILSSFTRNACSYWDRVVNWTTVHSVIGKVYCHVASFYNTSSSNNIFLN